MKIILNNKDLNKALDNVTKLGFVPTMGSLHKGHISLIRKSNRECQRTLVSIFINPTQFNNKKDFNKYPRNNKKDLLILKKYNVDYVYIPKKNDVYNFKRIKKIKLSKKNKILCAKYRKGHFEGVLDVMDRLTKLVRPLKIYMGEKDFQQFILVKKYIEKKYNSKIILCKTVRDFGKLALSSRNLLLNNKELNKARSLSNNLINFKKILKKKTNLKKILFIKKKELSKQFKIKIQYLELRNINNFKVSNNANNSKLFIAYYINKVRLIDNY